MTTRWEVEKALDVSEMEPTGRHIVLWLLTKTRSESATILSRHVPTVTEIEDGTGYSRSTLGEWMKVLFEGGWIERTHIDGEARLGMAIHTGNPKVVRAPRKSSRKGKLKEVSGSAGTATIVAPGETTDATVIDVSSSEDVDAASRQARRQPEETTPAFVAPGETFRSARRDVGVAPGETLADAPIRNTPTVCTDYRETITTTTPLTREAVNEQPASTAEWTATDRQPPPSVGAKNPSRPGKQQALIAKPRQVPERVEIIYDWLRFNGYPEATIADAEYVHRLVAAAYGTKVHPGYLRSMASQTGGGFAGFYESARKERGEQTERQIRELQRTKPACVHGTLAGAEPHPTHPIPICPLCRLDAPAPVDDRPETDPDVIAGLDAFRANFTGHWTVARMIRVAQEAEALRVEGASREQIAELGAEAGAAGISLIAAIKKGK